MKTSTQLCFDDHALNLLHRYFRLLAASCPDDWYHLFVEAVEQRGWRVLAQGLTRNEVCFLVLVQLDWAAYWLCPSAI